MIRAGKFFAAIGLTAAALFAAPDVQANTQTGIASWYQMGTQTANGERYNPDGMTAAHRMQDLADVMNLIRANDLPVEYADSLHPYVADKFREVGFTEVEVKGSGRTRNATGLWPHDDASAEVPSEVSDITMVA